MALNERRCTLWYRFASSRPCFVLCVLYGASNLSSWWSTSHEVLVDLFVVRPTHDFTTPAAPCASCASCGSSTRFVGETWSTPLLLVLLFSLNEQTRHRFLLTVPTPPLTPRAQPPTLHAMTHAPPRRSHARPLPRPSPLQALDPPLHTTPDTKLPS